MAFVHGVNTKILVDDKDLSAYFAASDVVRSADTAGTTTYGAAGNARTFVKGLNTGTVRLAGFFDGAVGAVDEELSANLTATGGQPVTVGFEGLANGKRLFSLLTRQASHTVGAPMDGAVVTSADFQADGPVDAGISLKDLAAVSATENGTSIDNAAASTNGGVGTIHVTANSRNGSIVCKVQHSTDNSVWADLITFATIGASTTTSERVAVTGTVNRYIRHQVFSVGGATGSATIHISFARR